MRAQRDLVRAQRALVRAQRDHMEPKKGNTGSQRGHMRAQRGQLRTKISLGTSTLGLQWSFGVFIRSGSASMDSTRVSNCSPCA